MFIINNNENMSALRGKIYSWILHYTKIVLTGKFILINAYIWKGRVIEN